MADWRKALVSLYLLKRVEGNDCGAHSAILCVVAKSVHITRRTNFENYYWPSPAMTRDVRRAVAACPLCAERTAALFDFRRGGAFERIAGTSATKE